MERWEVQKHSRITVVPSYGGWIWLRNILLHLWSLETFKAIGNCFGGFIEYSCANSLLIDCLEVAIKVENNYYGFIPMEVRIFDKEQSFLAQVSSF